MVASVRTVAFSGIEARPVDVQVQISGGLPAFNIVGLPDKAVGESRERVRSALHSLGLALPAKRLTVNLAPADMAKEGSHYDLPIALGLLAAMEVIPKEDLHDCIVLGELALDSNIRWVAGVLPSAIYALESKSRLICPEICGSEAAWAGDVDIIAPADLLQLLNHFKGNQILTRPEPQISGNDNRHIRDLSEIKGQNTAKRALEIAAAGGHNMLMIGSPGAGKSMLASCLPSILPPLSPMESLEVSMIHSLAGSLPEGGLVKTRPFRDPHYSASLPALVGGGQKAKPGEISLAHCGVLFLDELPEFSRGVLESLRQPLETGKTLVARANVHAEYPARFQLIAAMNPCRCGYLGEGDRECNRAPRCEVDYQSKISGPLLDRIDIRINVTPVKISDLNNTEIGESSETVAKRVLLARQLQEDRYKKLTEGNDKSQILMLNSSVNGELLDKIAIMEDDATSLLTSASEKMNLSARGFYRTKKLARTIADLDNACEIIKKHHIAEALGYRHLNYK